MALIRLNVQDPDASNDYLKSLTGKLVGDPPALDDLNRLGQIAQGNFTYISQKVAASLGFGFGSVSGSVDRKVMTFDYVSTANQKDHQNNGIDSWTYGAGYRIGILTYEAEATAQISFATLAAKATLEKKQFIIQILCFGAPGGPEIPVPNFADFNVETYGKFIQWQNDVIQYINKDKTKLTPIRIYASLSVDIDNYINNSAPLMYTLRRLQDKDTLTQALKKAADKQIPHVVGQEHVIRAIYAKITGYGEYLNEAGTYDSQVISDKSKSVAEALIQQYDKI
jgi:hypothetical protein